MTIQPTFQKFEDTTEKPKLSFLRRAFMGGGLSDLARLPRYIVFAVLGGVLIWGPIAGYLKTAPLKFKSQTSLIMPGSGASASMNLNGIGQASSYANSAFASNAVSPTETYKRLLGADRILAAAAASLGISQKDLGRPRVELVDQTSLIHFEMVGSDPEDAQYRGEAILKAFFVELDALRDDELDTREDSGLQAIADYQTSVARTRGKIKTLQNQSGLLSREQYGVLLDRHLMLQGEIKSVSAELSEKDAAVAGLQSSLGIDARAAAATLKLFADGGYLTLRDEVARFEAILAESSSRFGQNHPKVEEARKARETANKSAIRVAQITTGLTPSVLAGLDLAPQGARAELLAQLVRMDAERAGHGRRLETLKAQFAASSSEIDRKAPAAAELQDLERDFSVAEAVFASAIAKAQTGKSDVYASYPLVQVLENPSLPEYPSSPNRKLAIAAGAAATLMLFFGLLLGWIRLALIERLLNKPSVA